MRITWKLTDQTTWSISGRNKRDPDLPAAHVIRLGAAILEPRLRRGPSGEKRGKRAGSEADEGEGTARSRPAKGGSQERQPAARPQRDCDY